MRVIAALATIPERAATLRQVLESLRPQVDYLAVYCNCASDAPAVVKELADEHIVTPNNRGPAALFEWADKWDGMYLSCGDDIVYPADYAKRMRAEVDRFGSRALIVGHGHTISERGTMWRDHWFMRPQRERWINWPGTGVMAFDARVMHMPQWAFDGFMIDYQLAVWAQQHQTPVWLTAHRGDFKDVSGGTSTLWSRQAGPGRQLAREYGAQHGWRVHRA